MTLPVGEFLRRFLLHLLSVVGSRTQWSLEFAHLRVVVFQFPNWKS
jgi:hypothetical protein